MKISRVILLFAMSMILISCGSNKNASPGEMSRQDLEKMVESSKDAALPVLTEKENEEKIKEIESTGLEHKSIRNYEMVIWDEQATGIKTPTGILCRENDILILDKGNDMLVRVDNSLNLLEKVGKLGGSELEFQSPTGIVEKEEGIYIIDSGNRRAQVLNEDLSFQREIKEIERNTFDGTDFKSIAIDDSDHIYLAGNLLMERKIVWNDGEGKAKSVLDNFYGTVCSTDKGAYAINRGQVFAETEKKTIGIGYGKNALFSLDNGQAKEVLELPENLGVLTFCIKGEKIYVVSHSQQAVMSYNLDGEYIETIGKLQDMENKEQEFYIDVDNAENVYVTRPEKSRIDVYS